MDHAKETSVRTTPLIVVSPDLNKNRGIFKVGHTLNVGLHHFRVGLSGSKLDHRTQTSTLTPNALSMHLNLAILPQTLPLMIG